MRPSPSAAYSRSGAYPCQRGAATREPFPRSDPITEPSELLPGDLLRWVSTPSQSSVAGPSRRVAGPQVVANRLFRSSGSKATWFLISRASGLGCA